MNVVPLEGIQRNQIGRIFASWVMYLAVLRKKQKFLATFFHGKSLCINFLQKNVLGYILADFFKTHLVTVKESSGLFGEKNANATPSQIQKLS
jgi:hypothetical protein